MTLRDRISLTWRYGKGIFLIGAVYNLVCAGFQTLGFSYTFMVDSFILKVALLAITMYLVKQFRDRDAIFFYINLGYLVKQFRDRDAIFFYINLGLSRRKLLTSVILIDFLALAILMTIMFFIYG